MQPFFLPITHYQGVEEGEAWTEGSTTETEYLSAQPGGEYSIRLEVEKETNVAGPITVTVEQGAARAMTWFLAFLRWSSCPARSASTT